MTGSLEVSVHKLAHGEDLDLPAQATPSSSGVDLLAAVETTVSINPGARALIATGIAIALPDGYEAQVRPRSGLALKHGVTVLNSPGTIDADYRGEIQVILANHGEQPFSVERGMRIAQMVIGQVLPVAWREVKELPASRRGTGGFGSTGLNHNNSQER